MDEYKRQRLALLAKKPEGELTDGERIELLEGYLKRAETRQRRNLILFAVFVVLLAGVATIFLVKRSTDVSQSNTINALVADNAQRIKSSRQALLDGCRRSNKTLRLTINRNIVRPLNDALSAAASQVPVYDEILDSLATVPYAICRNAYPLRGKPHPPYFREAPLPPPISRGAEPGGATENPPTASGSSNAAPPASSPPPATAPPEAPQTHEPPTPGPQGPQGPSGDDGQDGDDAPVPEPEQPGLLDPVTDLTCDVTGICL